MINIDDIKGTKVPNLNLVANSAYREQKALYLCPL
jgi:hypothetical protein